VPIILKTVMNNFFFFNNDALTSPIAYLDPLRCSQVCLLASLFHDALNEFTYAAEVAGLGYALQSTKYGLQVRFICL
jgi:secreted Zn-dependent insulinase-like peptidase